MEFDRHKIGSSASVPQTQVYKKGVEATLDPLVLRQFIQEGTVVEGRYTHVEICSYVVREGPSNRE